MPEPTGAPHSGRPVAAPASGLRAIAPRGRLRRAVAAWAAVAVSAGVLLLAWELAVRRGFADPFFVSRPSAIAWQIVDWCNGATSRGPLIRHIGATLRDAALGLVAGSLVGWLGAVALARDTWAGDAVWLVVRLLWPGAWIALVAAVALAGGGSMLAAVACAALLVFLESCRGTRARRGIRARRGTRARGGDEAIALTDPSLRIPLLARFEARCGLALAGAVLGECVAARDGIGFLLVHSLRQFNASGVYAAFFLLIGLTLVFRLLAALLSAFVRGRPSPRQWRD
ncbi:hypothetical protein WKR88_03780 [Trinickia caryophylli]|uniref:ABC-type nitrate/sulfonate/bicarbonate transport system, permease component n=1 Tax=Trinickia caryophylli TaxID=28094 RepID=A0A1X7CBX4_TRICW|nr:hypothetical protein [Trinickia caryophylli]PMS12475.1 hypothetical protein C0Z17_08785 [Trinickia caryophylli]TRX19677.1 hypothetical protein FNF07_16635 [Trinickia caryophylli]WQE13008.1 hypothetical protein U0034_06330 [Trinickia caryophylli]SME93720.1 ABC-type nitrate/sulfonate/bicarbonate transport system, permease component [Trinickia caryophylli]GLU30741.1 hypothetical protein Busp01_05830 [Trinickia caryophylli]